MKPRLKEQVVQVNVKLAASADRPLLVRRLSDAPGVRNVVQTFPDETDQELANLYIVDVDSSKLESALERLRQTPHVEYAEVSAPRKLIW
jgi:hypothetical protein